MQWNAVIENSLFDSDDPLLDLIPISDLWAICCTLASLETTEWKDEEENLTNWLRNAFHLDAIIMLNILMFEREQERSQRVLIERKRTKGDLC
jgi:hypothetical protein